MIPLYIVLYLVVGLIVKWLCERFDPPKLDSFIADLYCVLLWPAIPLITFVVLFVDWLSTREFTTYTKIRKFFRGF